MQIEVWKEVKNYSELYEVSDFGHVRSVKSGKLLKQHIDHGGYVYVCLCKPGEKKNKKVHRLVADAFIRNPEIKDFVNHKNGVKTDNSVSNLEWCTKSENERHARKHGLKRATNRKISDDGVRFIRDNYIPKDPVFGGVPLARAFGVDQRVISRIVNNEEYLDVI